MDKIYPINYDFIKSNIDNPVQLNTLLNASLFLQFNNEIVPLKIGLKSTGSKFSFTFELSSNKRQKNSVHITVIHNGLLSYISL